MASLTIGMCAALFAFPAGLGPHLDRESGDKLAQLRCDSQQAPSGNIARRFSVHLPPFAQ